ncbi:hypothetical protein PC119_g9258 [Phytophthora cactorum]|nr:hypothetical protein PC112_g8798 [Phytophthora cactorum]KAG2908960.1 hypothetical protein PC115_g13428 [Phytophthora cactorum]KAG3022431.1 hypothetical protein PC119_g9258 [Phytophthora cactorum]KAG3085536.1 hypothetical protein PC122_g9615 [Phytophthora cactorum]
MLRRQLVEELLEVGSEAVRSLEATHTHGRDRTRSSDSRQPDHDLVFSVFVRSGDREQIVGHIGDHLALGLEVVLDSRRDRFDLGQRHLAELERSVGEQFDLKLGALPAVTRVPGNVGIIDAVETRALGSFGSSCAPHRCM